MFVDGYDFEGATFNNKSIIKTANSNNQIKIKIINRLEFISETINVISTTKEIYQFYLTNTYFNEDFTNIKQIRIQFYNLTDISLII